MSDIEPSQAFGGGGAATVTAASTTRGQAPRHVSFNRQELYQILNVYGRYVADGEWRDYAIDILRDKAVFSIYRRSSEMPLFRIEKNPKLARRQGAFSVVAAGGMILKRGHDLKNVLRVFEKKRLRLVEC